MKPPIVVKRIVGAQGRMSPRYEVVDRRDNSVIARLRNKANAQSVANLANSTIANYGGLS